MRFNLSNIFIKVVSFFPITVIMQRYTYLPNRVLFLILFSILLIILFLDIIKGNFRTKFIEIISFLLVLGLAVYNYSITKEEMINFNDFFYLPFWVLFLCVVANRIDKYSYYLDYNVKFIYKIVIISNILLLIFWIWESSYFEFGRHRMGSGAFLLVVETYFVIKKFRDKKNWLLLILPCIAILNSTSRTYLIMLLVLLFIIYYKQCNSIKSFIFTIIPLILLVIVIIFNSDMINYFKFRQVGNFDYLGSITSGRTVFWKEDLKVFLELPKLYKWFGTGYNLIYLINKKAIDAYIYAHNDYINVLISNGIFGLMLYFLAFFYFIKNSICNIYIKGWILLSIIFIYSFNAFFNGQYNYPAAILSMLYIFKIMEEKNVV